MYMYFDHQYSQIYICRLKWPWIIKQFWKHLYWTFTHCLLLFFSELCSLVVSRTAFVVCLISSILKRILKVHRRLCLDCVWVLYHITQVIWAAIDYCHLRGPCSQTLRFQKNNWIHIFTWEENMAIYWVFNLHRFFVFSFLLLCIKYFIIQKQI